jgi:hypothetical protein
MSNNVSAPFSIAFKTEASLLLRFLNIAMILCQDLVDIVATFSVVLRYKKTKLTERQALGHIDKICDKKVNIERIFSYEHKLLINKQPTSEENFFSKTGKGDFKPPQQNKKTRKKNP